MLAFADVLYLLAHELARRGGGTLPLPQILLRLLDRLLLRHLTLARRTRQRSFAQAGKDANAARFRQPSPLRSAPSRPASGQRDEGAREPATSADDV
jgi:hypothetical protein